MKRIAFIGTAAAVLATPARVLAADIVAQLRDIEASTGGRLGVAVALGRGEPIVAYRGGERFAMCSTFKFLAVSAALARVDGGKDSLERHVAYGPSDLLEYAPVTRKNLSAGYMTLGDLCAAAIELSDNTAANLVVASVGGPAAVTAYVRTLGDAVTRLDRKEPELNTAIPGDPRDTTAPAAMLGDMQAILLGSALSAGSRAALLGWMDANQTGDALLRAGLPHSWRVGDKTGMGGAHNRFGDSDTRNDIAIAQPPHGKAVVIAAYLTGAQVAAAQRDAALARVARAVIDGR
ncbi:MAG: class A beta-lactamase [Candidatus Eremiobacteraeota bacterium]|nr:class A beta-lactamase [Candidatus Eremiobacteraeota bacterium]